MEFMGKEKIKGNNNKCEYLKCEMSTIKTHSTSDPTDDKGSRNQNRNNTKHIKYAEAHLIPKERVPTKNIPIAMIKSRNFNRPVLVVPETEHGQRNCPTSKRYVKCEGQHKQQQTAKEQRINQQDTLACGSYRQSYRKCGEFPKMREEATTMRTAQTRDKFSNAHA